MVSNWPSVAVLSRTAILALCPFCELSVGILMGPGRPEGLATNMHGTKKAQLILPEVEIHIWWHFLLEVMILAMVNK